MEVMKVNSERHGHYTPLGKCCPFNCTASDQTDITLRFKPGGRFVQSLLLSISESYPIAIYKM